MSKTAILLLIVAIGLGLYVWFFNPPARARAQAAFEDPRTFFVELYATGSASIQNIFSTNDEGASSSGSGSTAQGSFDLPTIWQGIREFWLSLTARFKSET